MGSIRESVGWDNWVRWMCEAVEVFGNGSVQPSFVSGVEMARPHGFESVAEAGFSDGVKAVGARHFNA